MLKSLKFKDDYDYCFVKGNKYNFKPITLLVGDQGCGKSTLLKIIKNWCDNPAEYIEMKFEEPKQTNVILFDLEKDNPRLENGNPDKNDGNMLYHMSVRFQSHGEVVLPLLKEVTSKSNCLILLDEPETSLSLRSQFMLIDVFKEAIKRNNQIIVSTHNSLFMEAFNTSILSLEHNKYVSYTEFKELEKQPNDFKLIREDKHIKKTKCKLGINCTCAAKTHFYNRKCENYIKFR